MLRDVIFTGGARVYSVAVSMIALVLTARWLGPEGRGTAVVLITWVNLFASVGYLSLGQVCLHRASKDRDLAWLGEAIGALLIVAGAASVIGWIVAVGLWGFGETSLFAGATLPMLLVAFAGLPFLIWEQYNSALLTMIGRVNVYNVNQLIARTLTLALLGLTILVLGWGVQGFLVATLAGQVIVAGAGLRILIHHAQPGIRTSLGAIGRLLTDGAKLHLNAIGVLLFSSADILMVQYLRGPAEAGIFQFATQIFAALLILPQAALLVLNGKVAVLDRAAFWQLHKKVIAGVMATMTAAAVFIAALANFVVPMLAGDAFAQSATVLQILCLAVIAAALNTLMGIQWIVRGLFLQASLLTLATGAVNCVLNLLLIPRYGVVAAAWAFVAGVYVVPFTANAIFALRIEREAKGIAHGAA